MANNEKRMRTHVEIPETGPFVVLGAGGRAPATFTATFRDDGAPVIKMNVVTIEGRYAVEELTVAADGRRPITGEVLRGLPIADYVRRGALEASRRASMPSMFGGL